MAIVWRRSQCCGGAMIYMVIVDNDWFASVQRTSDGSWYVWFPAQKLALDAYGTLREAKAAVQSLAAVAPARRAALYHAERKRLGMPPARERRIAEGRQQ